MRTIDKNHYDRFTVQAKEAKILKLEKTASNLDKVLTKYASATRDSGAFYSYSSDQLRQDVEMAMWDAAVRAMDYFGAPVDANEVQKSIDKLASDLIDEIRVHAGVEDGVGAHEPVVPGESRVHVALEVHDEED